MFQKNKKMDLYGEEGSSPEATPDKDEVKVEHHRQKFEILARALQVSVAKRSTESRQVLNGESVRVPHRRYSYIPGRSDGPCLPNIPVDYGWNSHLLPTAKRLK